MGDVTFKVDTREFHKTRIEYMRYTKRDLADVLNTKGFFIARRAVIETPRVNPDKLAYEFGEARVIRLSKRPKPGRPFVRTSQRVFSAKAFGSDLIRLAVIINARRAKSGKPGLEGRDMEKAMNKVYGARLRSTAFLASGWLGAIAELDAATSDRRGVAPRQSSIKRIGRLKGGATRARPFWITQCTIWNSASTTRDRKQALVKYGTPALQRAVDFEVASMKEYIEAKLRKRMEKLGIKFL